MIGQKLLPAVSSRQDDEGVAPVLRQGGITMKWLSVRASLRAVPILLICCVTAPGECPAALIPSPCLAAKPNGNGWPSSYYLSEYYFSPGKTGARELRNSPSADSGLKQAAVLILALALPSDKINGFGAEETFSSLFLQLAKVLRKLL